LAHIVTYFILEQHVGDKIIADAVEALLGCVVTSVGIDKALKLCGILKILPNQNGKLNTLLTERIPPRTFGDDEATINSLPLLQKTLAGYKINDKRYFLQALTHCSYPGKSFGTYEQLEFLGDAVLDFLVATI
jgi:dsRNA-specific ribonuclease